MKNSTEGILALPPSLLVLPPPAAPQQQEPDGHSWQFCHWHFAGIPQAAAAPGSNRGRQRNRLPGSYCRAVRGGCFGAIINPCTTGSPVQFLFTYLSLHVQTKSPTVWLCFGETFHFFFPAPNLRLLVLWVTPPLFQVPPALPAPGACQCSIPRAVWGTHSLHSNWGLFFLQFMYLKAFRARRGVVLLLYCELSVLVFYVDLDPGLLCLTGLDDTVCCLFSPSPFPSLLASVSSPKALGAKQLPILWNFYVE